VELPANSPIRQRGKSWQIEGWAATADVTPEPVALKAPDGVEIYAFTLTVMVEGRAPYQITVGNPVPDDAIPLLYPGSNLPAKKGSTDHEVVIDWKAALASFTEKKP
jgi:hypothetical protein